MRATAICAVLLFLVHAPLMPSTRGEEAAEKARAKVRPTQYMLECRVIGRDEKGNKKILAEPKLITIGRRPAQLKVGRAVPIVSGVRRDADYDASTDSPTLRPNISVLEGGTIMTALVSADRPGYVTVDVTMSLADVESPKESTAPDGEKRQSGRVYTQAVRAVECIELGKKLTLSLAGTKREDQVVEIVITEVKVTK